MTLDTLLTELKGLGPALSAKLQVLGLKSVGDLVMHYPRRYEDYSTVLPIAELRPGAASVQAVITSTSGRYVRRGMHITEAVASDESGSVRLVWFNQPYRAAALKTGETYFISGQYELSRQRFQIQNPNIEQVSALPLNAARILPVYRETKGLTSRQLRELMSQVRPAMQNLPETLPSWLVKQEKILSYSSALQALHFPASPEDLQAARRRLGFEEVFGLTLASLYTKQKEQLEAALPVQFESPVVKRFVSSLPFELTDGQRSTAWEIYQDMAQEHPMNRLVEGDVGSGKTVVAAMAITMALKHGYQAAIMAPTELLARQHAETLTKLLQPSGQADSVCLLVGSMNAAQKQRARKAIKDGEAACIVGTSALIQESVNMHKLALVIIDEQHRFGVDQRKSLMLKAGHMPHVLSLTATPIPRSLALTLYGELDISVLKQKPAGRQQIISELVSPNSRAPLFERVVNQLQSGRQMYVVCPLVSDSSVLEAQSAEATYEQLSKHELNQWRVGLLHGQMKPAEKQTVMEKFVAHELDVLVATTVIEVGVDVPNATVMLIENPERFGLAQLHQLRGRVGRGSEQSYCFLLLADSKAPGKRLRALVSSNDGFVLSELDLELRGPGAIYGTLQHGALDLRIAQLSDVQLLAAAQKAAKAFITKGENLLQYPQLAQHIARLQTVTNLN